MISPEELETAKRLAKISTRVEFQLPLNGGVTSICGNVRSSFILAMVAEIEKLTAEKEHQHALKDEVETDLQTMEDELQAAKAEVTHLKFKAQALEQQLDDREGKLQLAKAEIELLKSDASIKHKYRADALESELQAAKEELKEALSNEQASASAYVKTKAELDILRNPSDGRCMEIAALREEIKRIRELLDETRPMAEELIRTRGLLEDTEEVMRECFNRACEDEGITVPPTFTALLSNMLAKIRAERGGK